MSRRILIILGHPDPRPERLCRALAEAYHAGANESGHEVAVIDVARLDFSSLKSSLEWEAPIPESLRVPQEAIAWAEHLVIVFPLWLGHDARAAEGLLRAGAAARALRWSRRGPAAGKRS